jgi:hypothetical protein
VALVLIACGSRDARELATESTEAALGSPETDLVHGQRKHDQAPVRAALAADASAHLDYFGGRVVSNIQVVQVLYGTGSYLPQVSTSSSPSMATFYQGVLNSPYVDWLTEYNTTTQSGPRSNQTVGRGSFSTQVTITPSAANNGQTIDDTNIQNELIAQIQAGHLPPPSHDAAGNNNTYYAVFFPHGKVITQDGSQSCVVFCAYHGTVASVPGFGEIYYGVHPDMQAGSGCESGCGSSPDPFSNYTTVASHELIETITDPEVGLATVVGPPLAWFDPNNNAEIGDICVGQQATVVGSDNVTYTVQTEFSNDDGGCIIQHGGVGDFIMTGPSAVSVFAGSNTFADISTSLISGGSQTVSFSVAGLPPGATADFSPRSLVAGNSSTLSLDFVPNVNPGTYPLVITGTSATATHTMAIRLFVLSNSSDDFSVSASPGNVTVSAGSSSSTTIAAALLSGSPQTLTLSASGLPAGVTVAFGSTSITTPGSATLTFTAASGALDGSSNVTITGTLPDGFSHSIFVGLTVNHSTPTSDFSLSANPTDVTLLAGGTTTSTLTTSIISGAAQSIALSVSGLPAGVTATFQPGSVIAGASSTLTLSGNTSLAAGTAAVTVTGTGTSGAHQVTLTLTTVPATTVGIANGGFESDFTRWTTTGTTSIVTSGCHSGSKCARLGSTLPTNGDSTASQTFTAPAAATHLSFWFQESCPDSVQNDWATVTLRDNTPKKPTVKTLLARTCPGPLVPPSWTNVSGTVIAGHNYTITLVSHDDHFSSDPTFTLFDDVIVN